MLGGIHGLLFRHRDLRQLEAVQRCAVEIDEYCDVATSGGEYQKFDNAKSLCRKLDGKEASVVQP